MMHINFSKDALREPSLRVLNKNISHDVEDKAEKFTTPFFFDPVQGCYRCVEFAESKASYAVLKASKKGRERCPSANSQDNEGSGGINAQVGGKIYLSMDFTLKSTLCVEENNSSYSYQSVLNCVASNEVRTSCCFSEGK